MPGNRMSSLFQLKKTLVCRQKKIYSPTWIHFHILCIIREICIDTYIYIHLINIYLLYLGSIQREDMVCAFLYANYIYPNHFQLVGIS